MNSTFDTVINCFNRDIFACPNPTLCEINLLNIEVRSPEFDELEPMNCCEEFSPSILGLTEICLNDGEEGTFI